MEGRIPLRPESITSRNHCVHVATHQVESWINAEKMEELDNEPLTLSSLPGFSGIFFHVLPPFPRIPRFNMKV